jgi:O-antigen/teichoic acid export membrane protein
MAFLVGIQLARGLGVAGYGLYGSAIAAAGLGASIASGGLKLHATRDLSAYRAQDDHESAAQLVGWSLRNVILLGIAAALAVGVYTFWGLEAPPVLALSTMAVTALMALLALVGAILCGAGKLVLGPSLDTAVRPAVQSGLLWIALLTAGTIEPGLAMVLTFAAILLALPFGWRTVWRVWRAPRNRSAGKAKTDEWRKASTTMGMATVIQAAEVAIPILVVGAFSTLEQAGLFRVSTAIMVFSSLPITMIQVMVPAMASSLYQQQDTEQLGRLSLASATVMLFPTLGIAGCLWIFGESLLALAFGNDYRAAWPIMSVLAGASVLNAMGGISISLLHAARHDVVVTRGFAISLAVTCNALIIAVIEGSGIAFALAVLAGILVRTAYLAVSAYRLVGIDPTIFGALRLLIRRRGRGK